MKIRKVLEHALEWTDEDIEKLKVDEKELSIRLLENYAKDNNICAAIRLLRLLKTLGFEA